MSLSKIIIIISIVLAVALIVVIVLFGLQEKRPQKADLEFWGVFDDSDVFEPLISDFTKQFPYIQIKYYKKTVQDYEKDLLDALAAGQGPDILMLHHTWLPRYQNKIKPAPSDLIVFNNFRDSFVDVAVSDFVKDGQIYALPLSVDTLALYYNKDIFNTKGVSQPPKTWEEFIETVEKITEKDNWGNITLAGAAIGTARNINRSTDILCLLMLQSGVQMTNSAKTAAAFDQALYLEGKPYYAGQEALQFYTDFANPIKSVYTWNQWLYYSIDAFYEGRTAMMFNYAYQLPTVRAKSSYLNFAVAPMPQIKDTAKAVNYANYWGLAVSNNSKNPETAWQFINWLAQKEQDRKYLELAKRPTARRDLIDWQKNDPDLGVFSQQALSAYSWYQVDNSAIETILADMVESVVGRETNIKEAISKAVNQITLLMQ